MRRFVAAAIAAGGLIVSGGAASAAPPDQGNCISDRDNGGAAGERISAAAGPELGPHVATALRGGTIGDAASGPDCRP
jgi:hypothetical protein